MDRAGLTDEDLGLAVTEMTEGLIDTDLGRYVVKKRVALAGRGKRGGARTIVATNLTDRWFFLFGFVKNERGNINRDELRFFQEVAKVFLEFTDPQLQVAISAGEITEVPNGDCKAQKPHTG